MGEGPAQPKEYSEQEGIALLQRFLAFDHEAERELVAQLNRLLWRVFVQRWKRYGLAFTDLRGDCFELVGRWREERSLTLEPLPHLAQRLMKQCGRQRLRERGHEQKTISLDAGWNVPEDEQSEGECAQRAALESELSRAANASPEEQLARKEVFAWLDEAREKLSPAERETFDAERKVADGEAASLREALGVSEAAAWQRRRRMRLALIELAKEAGLDELVDWAAGRRSVRRDKREGT